MTIIDTSLGYQNLKLIKKLSYLSKSACQFGRYRSTRLTFCSDTTDDMFLQKIDKIFKDLPNVFGVVDYALRIGFDVDDKDHDKRLKRIMKICW